MTSSLLCYYPLQARKLDFKRGTPQKDGGAKRVRLRETISRGGGDPVHIQYSTVLAYSRNTAQKWIKGQSHKN
jgi:hypothetical protein